MRRKWKRPWNKNIEMQNQSAPQPQSSLVGATASADAHWFIDCDDPKLQVVNDLVIEPDCVQSLLKPRAMRQANTVSTIFGLTSSRSSGSAYTLAPIFLAMEMAYLPVEQRSKVKWHLWYSTIRENSGRKSLIQARKCGDMIRNLLKIDIYIF